MPLTFSVNYIASECELSMNEIKVKDKRKFRTLQSERPPHILPDEAAIMAYQI